MYFKSNHNLCFFIAEIGSNHEGSISKAKQLVKEAVKSKADLIKLQIYSGDGIVNKKYDLQRFRHFERLSLRYKDYVELSKICRRYKKKFCASVWNKEMVKSLKKYIDIYKIGSGDLNNFEIIKEVLLTSKPLIISTGMANNREIEKTLKFIKKIDNKYFSKKKIAILHCNTAYPTPPEDVNLENIKKLKIKFKLCTGYSDHTIGDKAILAAYLKGAEIIEKHFSNSIHVKSFRDHQISLDRKGVDNFMKKIEYMNFISKSKLTKLSKSEKKQNNFYSFRRSIYAKKNISKGEFFSEKNITCLRPFISKGLSSEKYFKIIGKKAKKKYKKLDLINEKS